MPHGIDWVRGYGFETLEADRHEIVNKRIITRKSLVNILDEG